MNNFYLILLGIAGLEFLFIYVLYLKNTRISMKNVQLEHDNTLLKEHYEQTQKNIQIKDKINAYVDDLSADAVNDQLFGSSGRSSGSSMSPSSKGD